MSEPYKSFKIKKDDRELSVRWNHFSGGVFFMVFWLTFWTLGCVLLFVQVVKEPQLFLFLFAIPFWASWVYVFCQILDGFFCREEIRLDRDGLVSRWSLLTLRKEKAVSLDALLHIEFHREEDEEGLIEYALRMVLSGERRKIVVPGDEAELERLAGEMNEVLGHLQGREIVVEPAEDESIEMPPAIIMPLDTPPQNLEPPKETSWTYWSDFDRFGFRQRGRFVPGEFFYSLFTALFWNCIVSVFLLFLFGFTPDGNDKRPQGAGWWFMLLFLTPFVAIGFVLFWGWLKTILEPVRTTTWSFGNGEAACRTARFGIGRRATESLFGWTSLKLDVEDEHWRLVFLAVDDNELAVLDKLTEAEARWMADVILREQRSIR